MKEIPLTRGMVGLIDDEDYALVSLYKWCVRGKNHLYVGRSVRFSGKVVFIWLHRFLMGPGKELVVDHINGNGLDNRRINLRICSVQQNNFNMRKAKNKTSIYKGVSWNKHGKSWRVSIKHKYKVVFCGYFKSEKVAAIVYDREALKLYGNYAKLNFPQTAPYWGDSGFHHWDVKL